MNQEKLQNIYNKKKDSIYFKKDLERISKEDLETSYKELSKDEVCKKFHITIDTFNCLMLHYNIPFRTVEEEKSLRAIRTKEARIRNSGSLENSYKKGIEAQKETLIKKYGSLENAYNNQKNSRTKTIINKYGVDNAFKSEEVKSKIKSSLLEKYGVEYSGQIDTFKDKMNQTKLTKWGLDNYGNWQKGHETRIKNSGSLDKSYQDGLVNLKKTMLDRYGVECSFQLDDINVHKKHSYPNECFARLLDLNNIKYTREFPLESKSYDFKVGNTLVEINPTITHNVTWSPFGVPIDKFYHKNKTDIATRNGYRCIHIWDWDNVDKIISLFKERRKLFARNCEIKEVSKSDSIKFIDQYHLQGYAKDSIRLGLYNNDELVSIMTFGKPRYNRNYQYELIRYCSSCNIVGGAEKLFSYFNKKYSPKNIISYCDLSKFSGLTYEKLGFKLHSRSISKHWYNGKNHITDNLLRQRGFDQLFGTNYGKGTSNDELMRQNKFFEVYDSGQATYVFDNNF